MKIKPKIRYVYKVVIPAGTVRTNTYVSGYVDKEGVCVTYEIGKFASPVIRNSKLFAFRTLQNAIMYARISHGTRYVFRAIAKKTRKRRFTTTGWVLFSDSSVQAYQNFWKQKCSVKLKPIPSNPIPKGTVFCDAIKLIEEIESIY